MAGRPRKRTIDETLDLAMRVFWEQGYASTSISDLSKALDVGPSSLYNSFGSKDGLYEACLSRYIQQNSGFLVQALREEDVRDALRTALVAAARGYAAADRPPGCALMNAQAAPDCAASELHLKLRDANRTALVARVQRGIDEGQLPADTDAEALGRFVISTMAGMSQQAQDGADAQTLEAVANVACKAIG